MSTRTRSRLSKGRGRATAVRQARRGRGARALDSRPIVLKLGGELLEDAAGIQAIGSAIAGLQGGHPLIVVHGGGRDIDSALARVGIAKKQVDGLRITDEATLDTYRGAGITRAILRLPSDGRDVILPLLDQYAKLIR